jgi:ABC-type multidrug transport system fused ATPase/permease subunit
VIPRHPERTGRVGRRANAAALEGNDGKDKGKEKRKAPSIKAIWPDLREMILPRRGLLAFSFLLMVINRLSGLVLPFSTKFMMGTVIAGKRMDLLTPAVLIILAATMIQGVTSFSLTQLLSKTGQRLIAELRQKVQRHVGLLSVGYYDANKSGVLVARIMSDVEGVRNLIGTGLVDFVGGIMTALIALGVLLWISTLMTLLTLVFVITFGVLMMLAFTKIRPIFRERGKINAEVTGRLTESLGGVRVVKGYHAEEREAEVFSQGVTRLLNNVLKSLTATSLMGLSATILMGIVGATIWYVGAHQIMSGKIKIEDLIMYIMFLAMLIAPVAQVVNIGTQLTEALAGLDRTREVLSEKPEDRDPNRTELLGPIRGEVDFNNVGFSYDAGKQVLFDVTFQSAPGTVTALVGSSGSGKSTIISLVAAFHTPDSGVITVDGVDLSKVRLDTYRTQLGVVLQDTFLFDGTIEENIAFARPNATKEQVREACRIARVDEFADTFELKYDTIVGERGVKLSGGQRQRVSIARAILADPRILILDEATSSLDSESEALIQEGLKYLMKGRTTFVIAHRLSTIRRADQILVVEAGRIVERGTHESLYALHGRYWDLYTRQHGVEMNMFLAPGEGDKVEEENGAQSKEASAVTEAMRMLRG